MAAFLCDAAGSICGWSDAAAQLFGYAAGEAIGQKLSTFLDDAPARTAAVGTVHPWGAGRRAGPPHLLSHFVSELQNASGERLFLHMVWARRADSPVPTKGPEVPKDHVGTLAARIAHDFSALLAPVIGNVMLLEEEITGQQALARRVTAARQATEQARVFAQRLAALDGRRKLPLHPGDVGQIVRDLLPELKAALPANITLSSEIVQSPDTVLLDRKQLGQALLQLVLNAKDAMPGGGTLALSVATFEGKADDAPLPPGRWVRIQLRDSGRGMDAALLKHALEPFVSTKMPSCGIGLGLPTVATIVRQHDGLLDLNSIPEHGTSVSLFLPSRGALGNGAAEGTAGKPSPVAAPPVAKANILLVEDNTMVRRSIDATLRGLGYRVTAVSSGDECIDTVKRAPTPFDLLITDVVMPEMSGKELIDRVHGILPSLPVLFMSGYDRSTLVSRKQAVASEHFLQKPFDGEDLAAAVAKAMGTDKPRA
jgi:signal transduction histidine kinase/ActR/RegA family two-component response regulator